MKPFTTDATRWDAVKTRVAAADNHFWYAVRTTGVYCRPSCAARQPLRENVAFFDTPEAARKAGFRSCKRCRPDDEHRDAQHRELVEAACRKIGAACQTPKLEELARECADDDRQQQDGRRGSRADRRRTRTTERVSAFALQREGG